ncbi:MAG TPA: carboxypeptidase-like regulatory domain-containing protein [Chitinophagaceae bacterium]|nr:carboxypeptidase-like regulatory domain-containing protein [Chitinophagaceae bacterium]
MKKDHITLCLLLLLSDSAFSQIEGDVRSTNNDRIPKAIIIALDTLGNGIDSVITDNKGFYSFINLKPGKYLIEAKAVGYQNRLYKNIVANERIVKRKADNDVSNATRLQIVLVPAKTPK